MSLQGYGTFGVAGQFNISAPTPVNGQIVPLQLDSQGNLLVNVAVGGGGGGSNASVGLTGANVPTSATYVAADNPGGKLTGLAVDASGNLLVNVAAGGSSGAQFAMGSVQSSSALGTIALGYDGANVRGLLTDTTGQLKILVQNTVPVTLTSTTITGTVAVTQSTSPWVTSDNHFPAAVALSDALANPTTTEVGANLLGWDATNSVWRRLVVDAGTGVLQVDASANPIPVIQNTVPWTVQGDRASGSSRTIGASPNAVS